MAHGVVVLFPRKRTLARRVRARASEIFADVLAFERTHARVAWSVTLFGFVVGVALRAL